MQCHRLIGFPPHESCPGDPTDLEGMLYPACGRDFSTGGLSSCVCTCVCVCVCLCVCVVVVVAVKVLRATGKIQNETKSKLRLSNCILLEARGSGYN